MIKYNDGNRKYDAKQLTMHRHISLDNYITPTFDDNDGIPVMPCQMRGAQYCATHTDLKMNIREYVGIKRDWQLQRGVGGTSKSSILNQIRVPQGAAIGKDYLLKVIGQYIGDFSPILLKTVRNDVVFFVDDDEKARAIKAISRRIKHPQTNCSVIFLLSRVPTGFVPVCTNEKRFIEEVLRKRYNAENHSLDLSEFSRDEGFSAKNFHFSLSQNNIMMAVVDLINEIDDNITILNVQGNNLRFLDYFANLVYRIKNLRVLDLSSNYIDQLEELEKLKGWPVQNFCFENNPICSKFGSATAYVSAIHRIFPKVALLDGIPVQRVEDIGIFNHYEDHTKIPPLKPSHYETEECRALIDAFVKEFITAYDSPNVNERKYLINAYEENATFSLMAENLPDAQNKRPFYENYKTYRQTSHNIKNLPFWEHFREKILYKGSMDIVVELSKLPRTRHLVDTFLLDVFFATDKIICFALQGFFQDGDDPNTIDLKFFCRNFVVKCKEEKKVAVLSDILFISGVFTERFHRYKALLSSLLKLPPNVNDRPYEEIMTVTGNLACALSSIDLIRSSSTLQRLAEGGDVYVQQFMIYAFSKQSSMKPEWSKKCLEDFHWNFAEASEVFIAVQHKIPLEAFQQ